LDRSLICPVCPGETLDQSQVSLAKQMREVLRERLQEGWSNEEILQYFVDRYGPGVLAAPPKGGFNLVAWVVPPLAVLGGIGILVFVLRGMSRPSGSPGEGPSVVQQKAETDPYLALVDRELKGGRQEGKGKTQGPSGPTEREGRA
jgi:cytochrome c-type biogenesis protein CcmH